jgi:hypothetical protein
MARLLALGLACAAVAAASAWAAVARDSVTIRASRLIAEDGRPVLLSGQVSNHRGGERVILEQDDCGPIPWHRVLEITTGSEGGWRSNGGAEVTARFRVRWRKAVSRAVTIKARPIVNIEALTGGFKVQIWALHFFQSRTAHLERYELATQRWKTIARTRLKRVNSGGLAISEGVFRTKVSKNALVRAVLPAGEALPCYTAGFSRTLRVG